MAPLEPWEKVLVSTGTFTDTVHGQLACSACHGGQQSAEKEVAHTGLITDPSEDAQSACGDCHPDVVAMEANSLHKHQTGYWTILDARSGAAPENHQALNQMFGNHCASCHADCGDCHVSQPDSVGGGFVDGHLFNETPSMTRNCTACHGSRVGNEYLGKHEGVLADVHFRQGRMTCVDCHTSHEMHGQPADCKACHAGPEEMTIPPPDHRYEGVQTPRCETCHVTAAIGRDGIEMHEVHGGDLSCQVCHSVSYTSCDGCHVQVDEDTGAPFYRTGGSYMTFAIGRNPRQSFDRPYDFVPLRHVPIDQDSFAFYGEDLLPLYDALPTWVYATPHNIQRETPQTASCNACHGNADLFLTEDKVYPQELEANRDVIVDEIPAPVSPITGTETLTATVPLTNTNTITDTEESP